MCASTVRCPPAPPPLGARPFSSGYAQNRHEIPRMLRNHHANPPTRTPATARMCRTEPRPRRELWVCELFRIVRDRRSSVTAFQLAASSRPCAIWLSRNEAVSFIGARERPSRASAIGGRPLASESARIRTAETTRALEEERLSVKTQGEKYGSHR